MRALRTTTLAALTSLLWACGGDSATGPNYESIAGSYSGPVVGLSQGVGLDATISFTLAQSAGSLSGTWAMSGSATDGFTTVGISGTGTLSGTIASGGNPSVNISVFVPGCSAYRSDFSGVYDVANRKITVTGAIDLLNNDCSIFRRYQGTLIITR